MIKKILVIQTASIGDVILATPVLEKLHACFPDATIDFLIKKGIEPLFTGHPYLHEILIWDKKNGKYRNFDLLMHRVWHAKYDLVVNLQRFFLTGMMTAFSRAGMTIGFDKNPLSFLFTKRIKHIIGSGLHESGRNLSLLASFPDDRLFPPRIYPTKQDFDHVSQWNKELYYTLSPASLWYTKQYPENKWVELITKIPAEKRIFLLGSSADHDLCEYILSHSGHPGLTNLAGRLTLLESAALMKGALMNFTNDSAPMHLASAVNAPVTAIYCSTTPDFGFGPLSDDKAIVEIPEKLYCRPCGLHGRPACPEKHFRCAQDIPVELLLRRL